jgi:hypothetical protein
MHSRFGFRVIYSIVLTPLTWTYPTTHLEHTPTSQQRFWTEATLDQALARIVSISMPLDIESVAWIPRPERPFKSKREVLRKYLSDVDDILPDIYTAI